MPAAEGTCPATCPRCGATFACGAALPAGTPCACAGVGLTPAQRTALNAAFQGCLCMDCLRAVSRGDASRASEDAR
jgi:hypothetical protein